jgi:hypothetical protein
MRHQTQSKRGKHASDLAAESCAASPALMRKEIVTSAVFGLIGLLAPFVFILLLNAHRWVR